jgi:hypothetical protein
MTKRESDLLDIIKGYKGRPVKFLFLRRETFHTPAELRHALDKLIALKKIKQETTYDGIVYKVKR